MSEGMPSQEHAQMNPASKSVILPASFPEFPDTPIAKQENYTVRNTPVIGAKYLDTWKRARAKIRLQRTLGNLSRDARLYGSAVNYSGDPEDLLAVQIERMVSHQNIRATLNEEVEFLRIPRYIIHPKSSFRSFWNILVILLLFYTATVMPFRIAFYPDESEGWQSFDLCLDILFLSDVAVNCFSAYYTEDGTLVASLKEICWNYLRTWLLLDLCGSLPFEMMLEGEGTFPSRYSNFLRLARLPRLYRLLRIARVVKICKSGKESELLESVQNFLGVKHTALRMCGFATSVFVCVHLMSCAWFFLASLEDFTPDTWVVSHNFANLTVADQYIASVYWAVTTLCTIGYGDITPTSYPERIVAVVWMVLGVYFFSFTIGSLSSILGNIDTRDTILMTKLAIVDTFVRDARISRSLRMRLRTALKYNSEKEGYSLADKQGILFELPRTLRHAVAMMMHQGAAKELPFFTERDPMLAANVVPFLQHLFVRQGSIVYRERDYADEVYFITRGWCGIVYGQENFLVKKLQRTSYFGEIEVIEAVPRKYTVMAIEDTELLTMHKKVLARVQQDFPGIYSDLALIAETRDRMNFTAIIEHKELMKLQRTEEAEGMQMQQIKESVKKRVSARLARQPQSRINSPLASRRDSVDLVRQVQENELRMLAVEREIDDIYKLVCERRVLLQAVLKKQRLTAGLPL